MYSPYNPYGYLFPSPGGQQGGFPQTPQPMPQQPQPMQPPQSGPVVLQVGSAKEFDTVTLQPGRQALIMAQNEPFLAFKAADQMGMVTTSL